MLNFDLRKIYLFKPVDPAPDPANLPVGGDLYYECLDCTSVLNSVPHIKCTCVCGNLVGGGGELKVGRAERVRVVRGKLK